MHKVSRHTATEITLIMNDVPLIWKMSHYFYSHGDICPIDNFNEDEPWYMASQVNISALRECTDTRVVPAYSHECPIACTIAKLLAKQRRKFKCGFQAIFEKPSYDFFY